MPHLAPLSWSMSMIFFWALLIGVCSLVWWMKGVEVKVSVDEVKEAGDNNKVVVDVWKW